MTHHWSDAQAAIKSDFDRYRAEHDYTKSALHLFGSNPGLWVLLVYRLRRYASFGCNVPILKQVLKLLTSILANLLKLLTTIEIPVTVVLGHGAFIPHVGNIIVHYQSCIGDNCTLTQGVTLGQAGRGDNNGVPVLGDRVYLAPGAKILGKITIGNDVVVGANAVVVKSVPAGAVVGGIPAKILNMDGSADLIKIHTSAVNNISAP